MKVQAMAGRMGFWLGVFLLASWSCGWAESAEPPGSSRSAASRNPLRRSLIPLRAVQYEDPDLLPMLPEAEQEMDIAPPPTAPNGDRVIAPRRGQPPPPLEASPWGDLLDEYPAELPPPGPDGPIIGEYLEQYPLEGPPLLHSSHHWFGATNWYSSTEFYMMTKEELRTVAVAVDFTGPATPLRTLATDQTEFDFEEGARVTLGRSFGPAADSRVYALEATYWGLFEYTASSAISLLNPEFAATGAIETILGGHIGSPGFGNAQEQSIFERSDLDSIELNYRFWSLPLRDRLVLQPTGHWVQQSTPSQTRSFLAGIRYVNVFEVFELSSIGLDPAQDRGHLRVETDNDMVGVQIGLDLAERYAQWEWGLYGKLGGLVNMAQRRASLQILSEGESSEGSDRSAEDNLTTLIEAHIQTKYYVRPDVSLRLTYSGLYLDGIAGAVENASVVFPFSRFRISGGSLYHGLSTGLELRW